MSMTNPFGNAPAPTKYEDAVPGSTIEISGQDYNPPVTATVIQMLKEFGATSIPALLVKIKDRPGDPVLITSSGRTPIRIIHSPRAIGEGPAPDTAVTAKLIPATVTAITFVGGANCATDIIKWAAGKASISYHQSEGLEPEQLHLSSLNQTTPINIGDWVVKHEDDTFEAFTAERFAKTYDVDPSQLGLGKL